MPLRMVSAECWIQLKRLQDKDGSYKTYMFCQSKQRGLPCPRDVKNGKKAYELIPACFEAMSESEFLNNVILPGLLEPRTGPGSSSGGASGGAMEYPTVADLWERDENLTEKERREKELRRAANHVG